MIIRPASPEDATAMARVMVDTFLSAHRSHIPEEAWNRRKTEWTYEVSARSWERSLLEIAQNPNSHECIYVAEAENAELVGLASGAPTETAPAGCAEQIGEVVALYVRQDRQGEGIGRRLVQSVAAHLARNGCSALHIAVLKANAPARCFYEALGGQVVGEREFDEEGFLLPEMVYGWTDIHSLLAEVDNGTSVGQEASKAKVPEILE